MIEYLTLDTKLLCFEDFVMEDGEIAFRKDTAYNILHIYREEDSTLSYVSLTDEQGEAHFMEEEDLLECMIAI